jgi:hypothetical protein
MYKYILNESANEINWMGIFVLLTFVSIFVIVIFQVLFQRKEYVQEQSMLPLHDGSLRDKAESDHN